MYKTAHVIKNVDECCDIPFPLSLHKEFILGLRNPQVLVGGISIVTVLGKRRYRVQIKN